MNVFVFGDFKNCFNDFEIDELKYIVAENGPDYSNERSVELEDDHIIVKEGDTMVTMLDINERALGLAKKNIKLNKLNNIKVIESDGFSNISAQEIYDVIITNPPIRAGKKVIYKMYEDSFNHLNKNGILYLVINKKHGAPSTKEYLETLFSEVEVLDKKAGFNVIRCKK